MEKTYHVTGQLKDGTRFISLLVFNERNLVVKAGPALSLMEGWSLSMVESYIASKNTLRLHEGGF